MIQEVQQIARTTLANCAAFQSLVGAANPAGALAKIYHDAWPKPASGGPVHTLAEMISLRPSAIVFTEEDRGFLSERDASADFCWHHSGIIHFIIYRNVPAEDIDDLSKVDTDFRTILGDIYSNLIELSETPGMLAARAISFSGPWRTDVEKLNEIGDAQGAEIVVQWGVKG